ncbi:hypothetical protein RYX36_014041 [Vicia faba]
MNWAQHEMFKKALEELKTLVAQNANNLVIKDTHNQTLPFSIDNVSPSNIPFQNQLIPQQEFIEARRKANVCETNTQLTQISNALDIKKKVGHELGHLRKEFVDQFLWTCSIDRMNWAQHEMFKKALEELKTLVAQNSNNLVIKDTHNQTLPFSIDNVSPSNTPFQNQLIPQQGQMFPPQFYQNHLLHPQ